jgi:hypothetical protein
VCTFATAQFGARLASDTATGERKRSLRHVMRRRRESRKMLMKEEPHLARGYLPHRGAEMIRKKSSICRHRREFARKCVRPISRKERSATKLIARVVRRLHGFVKHLSVCGLPRAISLCPLYELSRRSNVCASRLLSRSKKNLPLEISFSLTHHTLAP